jgi:hypothetical protein
VDAEDQTQGVHEHNLGFAERGPQRSVSSIPSRVIRSMEMVEADARPFLPSVLPDPR